MKYKDIFLTASSNMFRSKLRTTLTILAIFIGAFTLTLTNGLGSGISSYIDKQVNNLGQKDIITITAKSTAANGPGSSSDPQKYEAGKLSNGSGNTPPGISSTVLTQKDIDILKADDNLASVQPSYAINPDYIQGSGGEKYKLSVSQAGESTNLDLTTGKQLTANAADNQLVLPISFVTALGFSSPKDAVSKQVEIGITDATGEQHTVKATVVAVQQKGLVGSEGAVLNDAFKSSLYDLQSIGLPAASKGKYQSATAKVTGDITDQRLSDVKKQLDKQGYTGQTVEDQLGTFKTIISAITYVLNGFAVITLLAAGFGIVNTLLMSVQERTKEIGLMKAMGMRSGRIFALFSLEAVLIGFWGSAIGIAVATLIGTVINKVAANSILKDLPGFNLLAFPVRSIALILLLIMGIAFLAGALPARRAAKQNPIDALRYE
jgi:putative ABC transport system permease protein